MSNQHNNEDRCAIVPLGQVGYRFDFAGTIAYIDPYLSHSVQELDNAEFVRLLPIPCLPEQITDADFVLITHEHLDHCDPHTLGPLAKASPACTFVCPKVVSPQLSELGIADHRIIVANKDPICLNSTTTVYPVPSAHPNVEIAPRGYFRFLGFVINYKGRQFYHAGDSSVHQQVIDCLRKLGDIETAFIPVNEKNYYRDEKGIIGNMSVREAFQFAQEIGAQTVVPTHWDMFAANGVYQEEIELLYNLEKPDFKLIFNPTSVFCIA